VFVPCSEQPSLSPRDGREGLSAKVLCKLLHPYLIRAIRQTQPHLFYLSMTTFFGLALTTITPRLQNFQNKAKYSAIMCTMWDHICVAVGITTLCAQCGITYVLQLVLRHYVHNVGSHMCCSWYYDIKIVIQIYIQFVKGAVS
jgi:hypothetical protein